MCILISSTTSSKIFLILRRIYIKHQLFLSDCKKNLGFLYIFSKNNKINFVKIPSVGDAFFDMDGQREIQLDVTELIVAFRSSANTPKSG
jgi:hypothetical protein